MQLHATGYIDLSLCLPLGVAKVPAKDCVEEAKAACKRDPCPVLAKISKAKLESADEPLFQALRGCGLAFDVPKTTVDLDESFKYPCIHPKDLLENIAKKGFLAKTLGVPVAYAERVFESFWKDFQQQFPQHDLFAVDGVDFSHLVPYYLHGDGGRTYKKDSILICSAFPAFGQGTAKKPVDLEPLPSRPLQVKSKKRARPQGTNAGNGFEGGINLLGDTLANRFLFAAIKTEYYKKNHDRFVKLIEIWGQWMHQMFREGFTYKGETWRILVLGLCGDAPFLREAGFHNRSFSNVRKSAKATTVLSGVCWLCDAGRTGGPSFENPDIHNAEWVSTTGARNPLPWDDEPGPLLQHLLVNQNDLAAFYLPDLFHIYHFGVGKDFVASSIVYMIKTAFKRNSIAASLEVFNSELATYFSEHKKDRCHFGKKLKLDLLGYVSSKDFPTGHWSKGADTTKLGKVLESISRKVLANHDDLRDDWILNNISLAAVTIGNFFRMLFKASFKLKPEEAQTAILDGCRFCRLYVLLARTCLSRKLCLFKLKPKFHMLCHILKTMSDQFLVNPNTVVNPLAHSTFQCEDFVGKVARISRRVSPKTHGDKILNRYFVGMQMALMQEASGSK